MSVALVKHLEGGWTLGRCEGALCGCARVTLRLGVPITVCVAVARRGLTRVSRSHRLVALGSVRLTGWCGAVTDCVSLPTRVCLGPKGTLGTLPGQAGRPRGFGRAGWAGSEVCPEVADFHLGSHTNTFQSTRASLWNLFLLPDEVRGAGAICLSNGVYP